MQSIAISQRTAFGTGSAPVETLPDPVPRPPARPPGEPIIIRDPPRPPETPEIEGPLDDEDEPEIKQPPEIVPEKPPPPPAPWDRADDRFARVIQQAVRTRPATYHAIVAAAAS